MQIYIYVFACAVITQDLSKFQVFKMKGHLVANFNRFRYSVRSFKVKVSPDSYHGCAYACLNPEKGSLEVLEENGLQRNNLQCYYFSYSGDGNCTIGLTNPGLSLAPQQIEDGDTVALTEYAAAEFEVGKLRSVHQSRCVQPQTSPVYPGVEVIVSSACGAESDLRWYPDGRIKHVESGLCLAPQDGSIDPGSNTRLVLAECSTTHRYRLTDDSKAIQKLSNNMCVHPYEGYPAEGKALVFETDCTAADNPVRIQFEFI